MDTGLNSCSRIKSIHFGLKRVLICPQTSVPSHRWNWALLALAGCLNSPQRVEGYIQFKLIDGLIEEPGQTTEIPIINVDASYEDDTPPDFVHLNEEWVDQFPIPRMSTVSESLHDTLIGQFDSVRYVVGTTSPGWAEDDESVGSFNVATTRENFNRVQVHSKVTASSDGTYLTIHSVAGLWNFDSHGW